jgi:glucose-6-phosphate isomerase
VDGRDVMADIRRVRDELREFAADIYSGRVTGTTGRPFKHAVVIGIGGSYLGVEFISEALAVMADRGMTLHYLANVDIHDFGRVAAAIDPETTLWIVISKSFTTVETEANMGQALELMAARSLDPRRHLVAVTSQGSPGDDPSSPRLRSFHMFDFIGGRYSVTSAVGGVPLSLALGYERFEQLLQGAAEMDRHAAETPAHLNLPLLSALVSVWNTSFMGYPAQAIIPYAQPLHRLPAHVQQLNMESNGKGVTTQGEPVTAEATGPILFGEPGTNAQHSFFQLAHQGRAFPIEFIGVLRPQYGDYNRRLRGVTNHEELWANLIAQPMALALGQDHADPSRAFDGNRPSSTLLLQDLSPASVGRLLAYYEARTVFEAFIWDINPFDQFGVELGKKLAGGVRQAIATRDAGALDPISRYYVDTLLRAGQPPAG